MDAAVLNQIMATRQKLFFPIQSPWKGQFIFTSQAKISNLCGDFIHIQLGKFQHSHETPNVYRKVSIVLLNKQLVQKNWFEVQSE